MFGIIRLLDGIEFDAETGMSLEEARNWARHLNDNPPHRYDESGQRIHVGTWVVYEVATGRCVR